MVVVITSGGVKEKIDNVRSITNSSSGKLGSKIAKAFLEKEPDCEIVYIYGGTAEPFVDKQNRVENIKIRDTEDLLITVSHTLITKKVDIFVHSMAVADYTTECVLDLQKLKELVENKEVENFDSLLEKCKVDTYNKISSYMEKPAVVLKKTPKVIEEIKKLSPYTFLVGFKLLDNVSEEELFDVGFNLLRKNRCNLVLANDIHKIRQGNHTGMLIYPEKTYDIIEGKDNIADFIVNKSLERFNVKHPKSIQKSTENSITETLYQEFYKMGKYLDKSNFLPKVINHERPDKIGTYGNMSCKTKSGFYITCRNVNKAELKPSDLSFIEKVDIVENKNIYSNVFYNSNLKPSIDTSIHSEIYKYSNHSHIVHIHTNNIFLGIPLVEECYPCGCDLECNSIVKFIKDTPSLDIIQMKKHGLIILGNSFKECSEKIENLFYNIPYVDYDSNILSKECINHINEVMPNFLNEKNIYPIKINNLDIGCLFEKIDDCIHFGIYTMEEIRGKKLNIVKKYLNLYPKPYILHTTEKCKIAEFYKNKYNFVNFNVSDKNNLQLIRKNI